MLQEGTERKGVSGFKVFYLPQESAWPGEWGCPYVHVGTPEFILWEIPGVTCSCAAGWELLLVSVQHSWISLVMCCPVAGWCCWPNWQGQCCCPSLPAGSRSAPTWNKSCKYSEDSFPLTEACLRHACFLLPPTALSCILRSLEKPSA